MTRSDLDKLTLLCRRKKIQFQVSKKVDGNYSIRVHEERRTAAPEYNSYELAKQKIEEILFLRDNPQEWGYGFLP